MLRPLLLSLLLTLLPLTLHAGNASFDICYGWKSSLEQARSYQRQLGEVLGREFATKLVLVSSPKRGYGVVLPRRGTQQQASAIASQHNRLLRAGGMVSATTIRNNQWQLTSSVTSEAPATPSVAAPPSQSIRQEDSPVSPIASNSDLEAAVQKLLNNYRQRGLIGKDEQTAWSVFDFTTGKKMVDINEDAMLQAASLIKPLVAVAYFHLVDQGKLVYSPLAKRQLEQMIQHSNNNSTNWVLKQVGGPAKAQALLKQHYPQIFESTRIVEYIPKNGRTYRNKASAHDYSRFLFALWNGGLPNAQEIKRLMALPGPDRIMTGTKSIPDDTQVYNKTGSTSQLCGDMGILVVQGKNGKKYPYTMVGVIEKNRSASNYSTWIRARGDVIREVSDLVYEGMRKYHNL